MASSFWTTSTKAFGHSILVSRYWRPGRPGPFQSLGRQLDCSWIAVLERWHVAMDVNTSVAGGWLWFFPLTVPEVFSGQGTSMTLRSTTNFSSVGSSFGVFTPIFRVHGAGTHTEIWNFGMETMNAINTSAITLRYRQGSRFHDDIYNLNCKSK